MPSFSDVPFEMPEMVIPPDVAQSIAIATEAMYQQLVARADDIWVVSTMNDPDPVELTEDEIDMYRTGVVAGITVLMEQLMAHHVLDPEKFVDYLVSQVRP